MGPGRLDFVEWLFGMRAVRLALGAAALVALSIALGGCGGSVDSAAADGAAPQHGGELVIGMDQEPQCLNSNIQCGSMAATSMVMSSIFDGLLTIDKDGNFAPRIALEVPTRENGLVVETPSGGMDVTQHIDPKAAWSDDRPITCEDVAFTWATTMDDRWSIVSRKGWELVSDVECPDRLTVIWHFKERYAPYLGLVSAAPLPKHILDGKDFNTYFNDNIPISSGPYAFDRWDRSIAVVLKRNDHYWNAGADKEPYLDHVRYVFVADTNTLKIQLRTGEVDVVNPPPDSTLADELKTFPRSSFQSEPGVYWEQIAFNTGKAPTSDVNVRRAIAYSIDRDQIADVVLKGQVDVLNSTLLPAKKEFYIPAWQDVKPDAAKVKGFLEKAGYQKQGTYFTKDGAPLTIVFKSTAGNNLRLKVAQLLQQRLKSSGIKMEIRLEPPNVFFGQSTIQGSYDMALWAWSSGVDPSQTSLFSCDSIPSKANDYSGQNNYRYCNEHVSELMKQSDVTTGLAERAELEHQIQTEMAADMPLLPLFQRPDTIAYSKRVQGIDNNPLGGFVWNVNKWAVAQQ